MHARQCIHDVLDNRFLSAARLQNAPKSPNTGAIVLIYIAWKFDKFLTRLDITHCLEISVT